MKSYNPTVRIQTLSTEQITTSRYHIPTWYVIHKLGRNSVLIVCLYDIEIDMYSYSPGNEGR